MPFCLSVSYFAPHAEDSHPEQFLPQEWSAEFYESTEIPMPPTHPLVEDKAYRALPHFLAQDENEGRVRFRWRFDTPEKYEGMMKRYYRLITGSVEP